MKWQRIARVAIATAAIAFAIVVGMNMRKRTAPKAAPPVPRADPTTVVESQGGSTVRINRNQEEGLLKYQRLLTYANGASKMIGVTITTNRRGQTFNHHVNFPCLKAHSFEIKLELYLREKFQLLAQKSFVPLGIHRQLIVGNSKSLDLVLREVLNTDGWQFTYACDLRRLHTTVPANHARFSVG